MSTSYGIGRGSKDKVSIFNKHVPHKSHPKDADGVKITCFSFVIQKLIERPLLFQGRKFDVRLWVLVNGTDGKCYLY